MKYQPYISTLTKEIQKLKLDSDSIYQVKVYCPELKRTFQDLARTKKSRIVICIIVDDSGFYQ